MSDYNPMRRAIVSARIIADSSPESPRDWDNVATFVCHHDRYTLGDEQNDEPAALYRQLICENPSGPVSTLFADLSECGAFEYADEGYTLADCVEQWRGEDWEKRCGVVWPMRLTNAIGKPWRHLTVGELTALAFADAGVHVMPLYLYDHSGISISCAPFSCAWDSGQVGVAYVTESKARSEGIADGEDWRAYAARQIESECGVYDQFLRGDVYGFCVEYADGDEDSCWGFYGSDPRENGMAGHVTSEALERLAECEIEYQF